MRLLLDTHVWLWRLLEPERISAAAEAAISEPDAEVFLSPISTWEALALARKGRVSLAPTPDGWIYAALRRSALRSAPLTHEIAIRSEALEGLGSTDPADRLLASTAIEHDLTLITADRELQAFAPLETLW